MDSAHTVVTETVAALPLKEHVEKLSKALDGTFAAAKMIYQARGAGKLNAKVKKLEMADGTEMGLDDLKSQISKIKEAIKVIPRLVTNEKKAVEAARRSKRAGREPNAMPPNQYSAELVNFFKTTNLGKSSTGVKLQDNPAMSLFFNNGIGNLTFGVSLFNVWGNICKLANVPSGSTEIVLDAHALSALSGAIESLKSTKRAIIVSSEVTEEKRASAKKDLETLDAGKLQNKDYMGILRYYCIKGEGSPDLSEFADAVTGMSEITRGLNKEYRETLIASRPKPTKTPKVVAVAVAEVPQLPKPAVVPQVAKVAIPAPPSIPTSAPKKR